MARDRRAKRRTATTNQPLFDVAGSIETLRTVRPAPGWPLGLAALVLAGGAASLTTGLSVTAGWLATRLAVAAIVIMAMALVVGSTFFVGLATVPLLAGATIGLDRPEGHAWGQTLLIGLLWYVATELAWESIAARDGTARSQAVDQLRVREVASVVAVTVLVGAAAAAFATVAPIRTVVVRGLAVVLVLACIVGVGRALSRRSAPDDEDTPRATAKGGEETTDHAGDQDLQR